MSGQKIAFNINIAKSVEAILYIANRCPGVTMYHVLKALFEADKVHLNLYARPVTGDAYYKLPYGTVPTFIYDLIKGQANATSKVEGKLPFMKDSQDVIHFTRGASLKVFSKSDIVALDKGIEKYCSLEFAEICDLNHEEQCWLDTEPNKRIDFEKMISDPEIIEFLQESSRSLVI